MNQVITPISCYLSGYINEEKIVECKKWRDDMTAFLLPRNVRVFNPLKHVFWGTSEIDRVKRPRMDRLLKQGEFRKLRDEMKSLNHWDLRCVDLSSFLIVLIDPRIYTCGTFEEIFIANKSQKTVLIVNPLGKKKMPNWLFGRFPHEHFFNSFDALKKYLHNIDVNPKYKWTQADKKRWLFFDGKHMY